MGPESDQRETRIRTQSGAIHDAKSGERLRSHLAERDMPCDGCGFNLRGLGTCRCPECGWVVPSPSVLTPRACEHCGYDLAGIDTPSCPECGRALRVAHDPLDWWTVGRAELGARNTTRLLLVLVIPGVIGVALGASSAWVRLRIGPVAAALPSVGILLSLAPVLVFAWWRTCLVRILRRPTREQKRLALGAIIVSATLGAIGLAIP